MAIRVELPETASAAALREFADRCGCTIRLIDGRTDHYRLEPRDLPVATNSNVVRMQRHKRQYVGARPGDMPEPA